VAWPAKRAGGFGVARQPHHVHQGGVVGAQQVHLLLREVADAQPLAVAALAVEQIERARHGLDEGRFALPVGP